MSTISSVLSCYVPYACSVIAASCGYLLSGGGAWPRLIASSVAAWTGSTIVACLASSLARDEPAVLGICSPLTIGASILGSIVAVGLFYIVRAHLDAGSSWQNQAPV